MATPPPKKKNSNKRYPLDEAHFLISRTFTFRYSAKCFTTLGRLKLIYKTGPWHCFHLKNAVFLEIGSQAEQEIFQ